MDIVIFQQSAVHPVPFSIQLESKNHKVDQHRHLTSKFRSRTSGRTLRIRSIALLDWITREVGLTIFCPIGTAMFTMRKNLKTCLFSDGHRIPNRGEEGSWDNAWHLCCLCGSLCRQFRGPDTV